MCLQLQHKQDCKQTTARRRFYSTTQKTWDPTGQAQESKPAPAQKVKKESPGESPRESPGILADAPKRVKNESPGDSESQNSPIFWFRRLVFDSFWGVRRDPRRLPLRLPRRLLFDFLSRGRFWLLCLTRGIPTKDLKQRMLIGFGFSNNTNHNSNTIQ